MAVLVILSVVVVGPLLYLTSDHPVWYVGVLTMLLAFSAFSLLALSQFVLSRYGNAAFDDVAGFKENVVAIAIMLGMGLVYQVDEVGVLFL